MRHEVIATCVILWLSGCTGAIDGDGPSEAVGDGRSTRDAGAGASGRVDAGGATADAGAPTDADDAGASQDTDAGRPPDAGAPFDAGVRSDAGSRFDAGASIDAGVRPDAGQASDAGVGCPATDPGHYVFPDAVDAGTELLVDPSFERPIGNTPQGWGHIEFGGSSFTAGTEKTLVHSGQQAYWYQRTGSGGGVRLFASPAFSLDHTYEVTLFARADSATTLQVAVMGTAQGQPLEWRNVALGPTGWTQVTMQVVYAKTTAGTLWLMPADNVRVILDDVSVKDVSPVPDYTPVITSEILPTQIGIHVNKWGVHTQLPDSGQGLFRFHDTGTFWLNLETAGPGIWNTTGTSRMAFMMGLVARSFGSHHVLFELGQTPTWAATVPTATGGYGPGAVSAPKDLSDYTNYVAWVANSYKGQIQYWELWNEYNQPEFWQGTQAQMVAMAKAAHSTLKAIDPTNQVLSPSVTVSRITDIAGFLDAGGDAFIDVVTFHAYFRERPEQLRATTRNVRRMMLERNVHKPVWVTEGGFACDSISTDCSKWGEQPAPTDAQIRGAIARALVVQRAEGVESFEYYLWDRWRKKADGTSGEPTDWTVNYSLVHEDFVTPTQSGLAFKAAAGWLVGAKLTQGHRYRDGTFVYELERPGGYHGFVVWNPDGPATLALQPTWRVSRVRTLLGQTTPVTGCGLTVSDEPVLLENQAP